MAPGSRPAGRTARPHPIGSAPSPVPAPPPRPEDKAAFAEKIAQRQAYAMRRGKSHIPDGVSRWECPVRAGKLGCPLVEGSIEVTRELALPVGIRPPAEEGRPACCTHRTFMIRVEPPREDDAPRVRNARQRLGKAMKHAQDEYWGDPRWTSSFAAAPTSRTRVGT